MDLTILPPWQKALCQLRQEIQHSKRIAQDDPGTQKPRPKETVVSSEIQWQPIDRTAAIVIAPASWIHKPPDAFRRVIAPVTKEPEPKKKKMKISMTETRVEQERLLPPARPNEIPAGRNPEDYVNIHDVAVKVIAEINKQPEKLTALARAAFDARNVLYENIDALGEGMIDFNARVKVALEDLRQSRFAYVTETAQMLTPLKEVRQFFIARDYEQEIARLKEFVELCERLEGLKQRGTLDALTDTILRLAQ